MFVACIAGDVVLELFAIRTPTDSGGDGGRGALRAFGSDPVCFLDVICRINIHLHVDGLYVDARVGLQVVSVFEVMPQHLRCARKPRQVQLPAVPEVLMGIDHKAVRRAGAQTGTSR